MIIKANGGISVISAFSNGTGAAASIELPMLTYLYEAHKDEFNSKPVKDTVDFIRNIYSISNNYKIVIRSSIPPARGLKSSSAMTLSIVYGILKINGINASDEDILKLSAEASIYNKTSITGAIDDLSSSYYGGLCVTDNIHNKLISRSKMDDYYVLIGYGKNRRKTYGLNVNNLSKYAQFYMHLEALLSSGFVYETMMLNGYIFESKIGGNRKLVNYMFSHGAIYAGQSGKGPAIFGIFNDIETMENAFGKFNINSHILIKSRFNNNGIDITME
ncbi:MAG: shikimate kinase [Ferroplasma sp.]